MNNKQASPGLFESEVFSRRETTDPVISPAAYNAVIGLTLLWGFAVNYYIVTSFDTAIFAGLSPWVLLGGFFVSAIAGTMIFTRSDNPAISFLGYNLVVIPFGVILNIIISQYDPQIVGDALRTTGLVTIVMMMLGSMYPAFFFSIARGLFVALLASIVVQLISVFVFGADLGFMDWIIAGIFCGYIGFDWARANAIPRTVDNAIDSAAALYMDIVNLFIRILSIMGSRD